MPKTPRNHKISDRASKHEKQYVPSKRQRPNDLENPPILSDNSNPRWLNKWIDRSGLEFPQSDVNGQLQFDIWKICRNLSNLVFKIIHMSFHIDFWRSGEKNVYRDGIKRVLSSVRTPGCGPEPMERSMNLLPHMMKMLTDANLEPLLKCRKSKVTELIASRDFLKENWLRIKTNISNQFSKNKPFDINLALSRLSWIEQFVETGILNSFLTTDYETPSTEVLDQKVFNSSEPILKIEPVESHEDIFLKQTNQASFKHNDSKQDLSTKLSLQDSASSWMEAWLNGDDDIRESDI